MEKYTVIQSERDFNIPLTPKNRSSRQKINEEKVTLNDILDQVDLTGIFREFHHTAEYKFFFKCTRDIF